MITLNNVNKFFNRRRKNEIHVINNTSLELEDNGLVAILGPSGCGKTTLLNAIGGLDKVNSGKIFVNGKKMTSKFASKVDKIRNMNIGYIFQDFNLIDNMTVFDNVALALKIIGIKNKIEIKKRVDFVLEKVGMYRFRNRPANMLSGGQKQRVGIARAIVKDPSIIIADEPTGNLDSKNTLEIMNIIKSISKNRLVILVTHESELANFYASRIINMKDGVIESDIVNNQSNELDYRMDNKIYLKDMDNHLNIQKDNVEVEYYSNDSKKLNIKIVVHRGNVYIECGDKLEIIEQNSSIELIDDHYKKIDKKIYEEYDFEFDEVINKNVKKRYSSIFNPISLITKGFSKVFDYSLVKKLLLLGFFISGMFIVFAFSSMFALTNVKDQDFITYNKNYLQVKTKNITVNRYLELEKDPLIKYILPGDSLVSFNLPYDFYYQTIYNTGDITGSLSSIDLISEDDLIVGKMPENDYEIIVDVLTVKSLINEQGGKQLGFKTYIDLLDQLVKLNDMKEFKIVGFVDLESPSIYAHNSIFINIISNISSNDNKFKGNGYITYSSVYPGDMEQSAFIDFALKKEDIILTKGRMPENDYEVIVHDDQKEMYPLNKTADIKINDTKLKVVGYYKSAKGITAYLVSNNTLKYHLITIKENVTILSDDKIVTIDDLKSNNLNVVDTYENSKDEYIREHNNTVRSQLIFSSVILLISCVEIFLMIRSSFLSRIKEVGIFRAIGVKKLDIYKMFLGEIVAITTLASLTGAMLMMYIVNQISKVSFMNRMFILDLRVIIISILFIYLFNILIGLSPVLSVIKKRPAQILSRTDLE